MIKIMDIEGNSYVMTNEDLQAHFESLVRWAEKREMPPLAFPVFIQHVHNFLQDRVAVKEVSKKQYEKKNKH